MKRAMATAAVLAIAGVGVVASTAPAQARISKAVEIGKASECVIGDKFCGPYFWLNLDDGHLVADKATGVLRDSRGKKLKLENAGADFEDSGHYGQTWWGPTKLKKGKYTFTYTAKFTGRWDCSQYYHDGCRWFKGYRVTKSKTFKYKPNKRILWTPAS